jgi:hypothetical protein
VQISEKRLARLRNVSQNINCCLVLVLEEIINHLRNAGFASLKSQVEDDFSRDLMQQKSGCFACMAKIIVIIIVGSFVLKLSIEMRTHE